MAEDTSRELLTDLRHGLLRLHKTLLDWERSAYEQVHGRQSGGNLLKLLLDDPHFAWLRPMSQTIVRIDEMLDEKQGPAEPDVVDVLSSVRTMISPGDSDSARGERYATALQDSPDVVLAHREVVTRLDRRR